MLIRALAIAALSLALAGCVDLRALLHANEVVPPAVCPPKLAAIPDSALTALDADRETNPQTGDFLVSLEKQYEFQSICAARHG